MNEGTDFDLLDPHANGVYFVGREDAEPIATGSVMASLHLTRIDLASVVDKAGLLHCMAAALHFPTYFGHNWDALEDCLNDLSWLPPGGYVLLFEHADALQNADGDDFEILLDILAGVTAEAATCGLPWHVFFVLSDEAFERISDPTATSSASRS